jgi:hypothetical protein
LPDTEILKRIKELVGEGHGAKIAFCRATGIRPQTLNGWYKRDSEPNSAWLAQIVDRLGVSADWLLLGRGPKYKTPVNRLPATSLTEHLKELSEDIPSVQADFELFTSYNGLPLADKRTIRDFVQFLNARRNGKWKEG